MGMRLLMLAAASLVGWTVLGVALQYFRTYALVREAARLERHREDLLAGNAALSAEIRRLRTDDQYLERLAREQLGMLGPGEIELVIVPGGSTHRAIERDPPSTAVGKPEGPFVLWGRILWGAGEAAWAALWRALERLPQASP
jgi:cell division protein FtsB